MARFVRTVSLNGAPPADSRKLPHLTAPIIDQFAGILCAGGTVKSHLGILSREFGIPCFMNAKLSGIHDGDRVEMEASADASTTEDYQTSKERTGRGWRLIEGKSRDQYMRWARQEPEPPQLELDLFVGMEP